MFWSLHDRVHNQVLGNLLLRRLDFVPDLVRDLSLIHIFPDLIDFTRTFFAKHTLLNVLTKYCVFTSENMLMVMRPYQITATERILNRIEIANNYKKYGTIAGGGYIWHTTGSGKTLTSFKTARLASQPVSYTHLEWQHPGQAAMKTLTDITPYTDYVKQLSALFESDEINDQEPPEILYPPYNAAQFLEEVYMDAAKYQKLKSLLHHKKNIVLQGAPGVGKTFIARRLAYSIMGCKNTERVAMVQFLSLIHI